MTLAHVIPAPGNSNTSASFLWEKCRVLLSAAFRTEILILLFLLCQTTTEHLSEALHVQQCNIFITKGNKEQRK